MNNAALSRALAPLLRRIRVATARAVVSLINDASGHQTIQARSHGDLPADDIEHLQNYGHFSVPLEGAEALVFSVGGKLDHLVALCVADHRYRPRNGQPGDAGVYHFEGHEIRLEKDGVIRVTSKRLIFDIEEETVFNSPKTTFNGAVDITDHANLQGGANIGGIEFGEHTHRENDSVTDGPQ